MESISCLYVVATPIGHLSDLGPRARQVLQSVDYIAAEDTRRTKKLLQLLDIKIPKILSYYDQNENFRAKQLIDMMQSEAKQVAIVSDAGTPCISDPGYRLVSAAHEAGIKVVPIPGASSVVTLISASGLPSDRFLFVGFLPTRENALEEEIKSWLRDSTSVVFFESPQRIRQTLHKLCEIVPGARLAIGRELTKIHEEITMLPVEDMLKYYSDDKLIKGELACMLSLSGLPKTTGLSADNIKRNIEDEVRQAYLAGYSHKDLCRQYAKCGLTKKELFSFLLSVKNEGNLS
ncbi:MAG: 16S rRNA (cytidine(1402)-2'-O)-methyltransferase [Bdellovibrionota bacterium]